jgi:hypothetical protein
MIYFLRRVLLGGSCQYDRQRAAVTYYVVLSPELRLHSISIRLVRRRR